MEAMSRRCPGAAPARAARPCRCRPDKMPLRRGGRWRKRWRYLGAFCDELLLCAARVQVGPLGQTFWAIWDREGRQMWERTRTLLPGRARRGLDGEAETATRASSTTRPTRGRWCGSRPADRGRRGAGLPAPRRRPLGGVRLPQRRGRVRVDPKAGRRSGGVRRSDRRAPLAGRGARGGGRVGGYHPHHTVWSWSAGVGDATDGRSVGWNLVSGINDPPERSERAIWVDGEPFEPGPVSFEGLEAIAFDDDSRLAVQRRVRAATAGEPPARPLHLPPAVRQLLRHAPRRARARARPRRHGAPRRPLVGVARAGSSHPGYTLCTCQRHGGSSAAGNS